MHRTALVRLAAFALVILGSFGTAYSLGRRLPGSAESKPHTHGPVKPSPVPPGFKVDGYVLVDESNQPSKSAIGLHVNGPDGQRVTDYVEANGSKLHVVLIRFDLSGFEHVQPEINADGSFVVPIDKPGKWHIVIDAQPAGGAAPIVLATNIDDEVPIKEVAVPKPNDKVTVDDLIVTRQGLNFTVTAKDGSVAAGLGPYLGQPAHLIAIRKGDLAYNHLHPVTGAAATAIFAFDGTLPTGTYRLFLQFGYHSKVVTVAFTAVEP
jgi:hypothetical protein